VPRRRTPLTPALKRPARPARPGLAALSAPALLQLMWLASPALPVGGFSYSEGLEAAVEAGLVGTEAQARAWLLDQLDLSLARCELAVVAKACGAWQRGDRDRVAELNAWVGATREASETRKQTEQMGRSLAAWLKNRNDSNSGRNSNSNSADGKAGGNGTADTPDPRVAVLDALAPAPTWPVAFALAGAQSGAPVREVLLAFAFGWAENMVQAALKAVPLGQSAGQRVLAALAGNIPAAADHALALADSERQAYAPMLAILSARHEAQYSRLFRS
jgi:urease accessory protein